MALFESYERRIDQINAALAKFDIKSIEEAKAICDEKGILVWQDFMEACGRYPQSEEFLKKLEKEVTFHVRRLRPAIVPCAVVRRQ